MIEASADERRWVARAERVVQSIGSRCISSIAAVSKRPKVLVAVSKNRATRVKLLTKETVSS